MLTFLGRNISSKWYYSRLGDQMRFLLKTGLGEQASNRCGGRSPRGREGTLTKLTDPTECTKQQRCLTYQLTPTSLFN